MSLKQKIPTKHGARVRTTIYGPERLFTKIKNQSVEDGLSFNQRMIQLLISGLRSEEGQRDRENGQLIRDIQAAVKDQYRKENRALYGQLERPLNRYEKLKEERKQLGSPKQPEPPKPERPQSAEQADPFSKIYDGEEKQEELEDKAKRYLRSNWHPAFTD